MCILNAPTHRISSCLLPEKLSSNIEAQELESMASYHNDGHFTVTHVKIASHYWASSQFHFLSHQMEYNVNGDDNDNCNSKRIRLLIFESYSY